MKIQVIMCPADREPYVTNIENTLENMQRIVGGYIEAVDLIGSDILICNEEGRLMSLPECKSSPIDDICGDAFIVGMDGVEFTDVSNHRLLAVCRRRWNRSSKSEEVPV